MNQNCGNCKFVGNANEESKTGCCRRFPPTLMVQPIPVQQVIGSPPGISWQHQASAYPLVSLTGWCGEHQADNGSAIRLL